MGRKKQTSSSTTTPKRGPVPVKDRLAELKKNIGPDGVKQAQELLELDHDIVRYAFYSIPKPSKRANKVAEKLLDFDLSELSDDLKQELLAKLSK